MCKVFISYSHDNEEHKNKVANLAAKLRVQGVDVELDTYTPHPDEGWPTYMLHNVVDSQFTLCICSQKYKDRFEQREPIGVGKGAKFEGKLITQIIYESEVNGKFIPILLDSGYGEETIPIVLRQYTHYNISNDAEFIDLYAKLINQEEQRKPPLGSKVSIHDLERALQVRNPSEEFCDKVKKQCIARFRSNGVDEATATAILNKLLLSDGFNYLLPQDRKTNYVVGDFGSGKSLAFSILYLQKIYSQESAIFLSAKNIPREINLDKYLDVDSIKEKTTVFIDGLDEISYSDGKKIIDDIILCETYCNDIYFVVSTRPSSLVSNNCSNQIVNIKLLSLDESVELMQQVSDNTIPVGTILGWREELKDTLLNPFFAILAGIYFKETSQFLGLSKQAFIKYLIQKSIQPFGMDEKILNQLQIIAVKYIDQEQNKILISDLPTTIEIQNVLKTGLIQIEDDYIYFSLPIIAQWLAASAIKTNIVDSKTITNTQAELIKWRYSIMLLMGDSSFDDSKELFQDIVTQYPGMASQIINDNVIREDINNIPSAEICGSQIAFCIQSWALGLKILAKTLIPYDGDNICTFKILTTGPWLYIWWDTCYYGKDFEVVTTPPDDDNYCYRAFRRVGKTSMWPWIVTFDFVSRQMKDFINRKPLFSSFEDLKEEYLYDIARKIIRQGILYREDISIETLRESLNATKPSQSVNILSQAVNALEKDGQTVLKYPHIQPDLSQISGWVWNRYSHPQTIKYIQEIYEKAINTYKKLCDNVFVGLSNAMPKRLMLPATMYITYNEGKGSYPAPTIKWYFLCKQQNQESEIIVEDSKNTADMNEIYKRILSSISCYRTNVMLLCSTSICTQQLDIFHDMPLHKIILDWLNDDLRDIGWIG